MRKDELTEFYLANAKTIVEEPELSEFPSWIQTEYSDIFLDGLPPGMPPERKVVHEIHLYLDATPQFRGIFCLS